MAGAVDGAASNRILFRSLASTEVNGGQSLRVDTLPLVCFQQRGRNTTLGSLDSRSEPGPLLSVSAMRCPNVEKYWLNRSASAAHRVFSDFAGLLAMA